MSSITEVRGGATVFTFPVRRSIMPEKTLEYEGILQDIRDMIGYFRIWFGYVRISFRYIQILEHIRLIQNMQRSYLCVCVKDTPIMHTQPLTDSLRGRRSRTVRLVCQQHQLVVR